MGGVLGPDNGPSGEGCDCFALLCEMGMTAAWRLCISLGSPVVCCVRDSGSLVLQDRLEHLRKQCGPHVSAAAKDSVEGICSKIYYISLEYVKRIREKHLAILKENNISGTRSALKSYVELQHCNIKAMYSGLSPFK